MGRKHESSESSDSAQTDTTSTDCSASKLIPLKPTHPSSPGTAFLFVGEKNTAIPEQWDQSLTSLVGFPRPRLESLGGGFLVGRILGLCFKIFKQRLKNTSICHCVGRDFFLLEPVCPVKRV